MKYSGNRFSWLGNGISQTEWDPTADLAYYIKQNDDDGIHGSRWKRTAIANRSGTMSPRELHRQPKLRATGKHQEAEVAVRAAAESS